MTIRRAIWIGLVLAIAAQFAYAQDDDGSESEEQSERVCINTRTIRSFDALTDEFVYVRGPGDAHYLLTTKHRCHNLRDARSIAFKDISTRVCSDGFSEIVYRDRFGSGRLESCLIEKIIRVDSKEAAEALVESLQDADSEWFERPLRIPEAENIRRIAIQ